MIPNKHTKLKIAIIQRVIFHYRIGLFEEISHKWTMKVFHGESVKGSKVINAKPPYPFDTKKLFTIKKKSSKNPQQILFFNPGLVPALIHWNPDILILEGSNNMLNNIPIYFYSKIFKKKYIWWGIGTVPGRKSSIYRKILTPFRKLIIRDASAILAYSKFSADYFSKITDKKKIFVFPNCLNNKAIEKEISIFSSKDKDILKKKLGIPSDCITLLYVGAMEYNKRIDILLDAFKIIKPKIHNIRLLLIGSGTAEENFKIYAQKNEINNHCIFLGKIIDKINHYFQIADIFVLPGRGGLAVNQALINGLAVVCNTPADGTELDMIVNGYNGLLIEKMDAQKLAKSLLKIISEKKYPEMGKNSLKIIKERYNIDVTINVLNKILVALGEPT